MRRITLALCLTVLLVSTPFAQQTPPSRPAQPAPPRATTPPAPGVGAPVAPPSMIPPPGQQPTTPRPGVAWPRGAQAPAAMSNRGEQNVQVAVTITDSFNTSIQSRKAVTMLIVDGRSGQVRSMGGEGLINIDARPVVQRDGRIFLQLTVEYRPEPSAELTEQIRQSEKVGPLRLTVFTESLSFFLPDGKPVVASQSSDPRSDRKVSLEVTATVMK